jgi:Replication initiator protein A/DnaA N-terminal domain
MLSFIRSLFFGAKSNNLGEKLMVSTRKKTKSVNTRPANPTPTKQIALLEADEENTDLLPQGIIRSEVNFLAYPFFALSRHDKRLRTEYHTTEARGDEKLEVYWEVSANPKYGYPGVFDSRVHKAIEHIISQMKPPIQNPVRIGSLLNLAKIMGLGLSKNGKLRGKTYKEIQDSLTRIVTTSVESKGTFYDRSKERWIKDVFHLYDRVVFIGQKLPNGEIADTNYLVLGSWYLESINARYVKPLDYTYYRSLQSPIASRFYELLGVKFKGSLFINYRYSKLCQLLPITRYQHLARAKQQLEPAHQELIRTGFFDNVEWVKVKDDPHDWLVNYWAGERAKKEIEEGKRGNNHEALPPPDDLQLGQSTASSAPPQADDDVNDDVANALQNFGISKKQALRLAKKYPAQYVLEKLELTQWLVDRKSPLVSKNPQGFLVKALEDDYKAPAQYKGKRAKASKPLGSEEQEARLLAQEEYRKGKEEARQRLLEEHPPQPIKGTEHTTESAWSKALASLQEQVSPAVFNSWLKDTLLLQVTDTAARIGVPNRYAIAWLERKMYREISNAMKGILGKDVDLEFVVASPE